MENEQSFEEYLNLRLSKSRVATQMLKNISSQVKEGKIRTKAIRIGSKNANGNGKTTIIRKLLAETKMEVLSVKDIEIESTAFQTFEDLLEHIKKNDNYIVVMSWKHIVSHRVLTDISYKPIHDIVVLTKQKNAMVIFEDYEFDYLWTCDTKFRLKTLFDLNITITERPPEKYRTHHLQSFCADKDILHLAVKETSGLNVSQFHAFLSETKSMRKKEITREQINDVKALFEGCNQSSEELNVDSITGRPELKMELRKIIQRYRLQKELESAGIIAIPSYLFLGPPGTGKTLAVRCLAGELDLELVHVTLEKLEKENNKPSVALHQIFEDATKNEGCILFIDEVEKLLGNENALINESPLQGELQQIIDGVSKFTREFKGILILNANQTVRLSKPFLDRFKMIVFETPNLEDRMAYIQAKFNLLGNEKQERVLQETSIEDFAISTNGCSYREIERRWADIILGILENRPIEVNQFQYEARNQALSYLG